MHQSGDIVKKLAEQGYRLTPQRMMAISAIEKSDGHISAEEIYAQVITRYPQVNISTVYRTLELLKKLGLVTETDFGEGRVRYHPAGKGHHHHLVCQECGAIIDLDEAVLEPLKNDLLREYGFSADLRHLAIFGRCVNCNK
jgi:Fur family ferric uptake transcriptional regulator